MQTTMNKMTSPVRSLAVGTWVAVFVLLALCLGASNAKAVTQPPPIVATGPAVQIGIMHFPASNTSAGWDGGNSPLSGTFVVGPNGHVIVGDGYSNAVDAFEITPTGTQTVLASTASGGGNSTASAIDVYGNAYIAFGYSGTIYKLPFVAGAYVGYTVAPTAKCGTSPGAINNTDTAACVFASNLQTFNGIAGFVFDGHGNLIIATDTNAYSGAGNQKNNNLILVCNAQCEAETDGSGTYPPLQLYSDGTVNLGAVAVDPWGNIFFTDGANGGGKVTNLNEIKLVSGVYAATPIVLQSYTNAASYSNSLSGLIIAGNGTIYLSTNGDGIFAIPNSSTGPNIAGMYLVSNVGGKGIAMDYTGNLFQIPYNGTLSQDVIDIIPAGSFSLGSAAVGVASATTASATIFDAAAAACPATVTASPAVLGVTTTEFAATTPGGCGTAFGGTNGTFSTPMAEPGVTLTTTISFTPSKVGQRNSALIFTDSADNASGTASLSGVGQGAAANVDPGASTAYGTGFTAPYSVSVDAAGDMAVADDGAGKVFWIPAGSPAGTTPTSIGTGFTAPAATAFDASGNLYIADFSNNNVVKIPYVSGALAPGSQTTLIPSTLPFNGKALSEPSALAIGPDGRLYIADLGNSRVVSYSLVTGQAEEPISSITDPWGIAVDASNNLYVTATGSSNVLIDAAGSLSTLTVPNVAAPWGIAIDASGSLIVSDHGSGNIEWVPDVSGTLTTASAVLIEKNPSSALGIALDVAGDLYTTDAAGKSVYAIQRTAAAINLGTVQDGITNSLNVTLESDGNVAATLATPDITEPTNTMFTLVPAASNGCSSGSSGNPGMSCQFTGTFAPPPATANGPQTGTAMIDIATPAATFNVSLSGTASVSSILPQTITGFNPPTTLQVGQQITLSATGGASGNPVVFTIDPASACPACATITGSVLSAVSTGVVKVDANQAGGTASGNQYAAATQVQASITINNTVVAADVPSLLMNQIYWSYQSGAFTDGQNPAGGAFAITPNGEVVVGTSYNNKADFISVSTGALLSQVTISGPGGFTTDSQGNLYMAHLYGPTVLKIPYVSGVYATLSDTSPANCTGTDTTLCTFAQVPSGGVKAIAFDPSGNLYMATVPGATGNSAIYECAAACQKGGTGTLVYTDANAVSQIAFDPWGNLFFAEGVYTSSGNFSNDEAASSNLDELPYTAGTGFAATPTVLQTLTVASPGGYDNQLDGVAVTSTGTIYYATQNEGTFAIPNTKAGGPDVAHQYAVSTLGAKGMELDSSGNEWVVVYHAGGDNLGYALLGDLTTPNAQYDGAPVNAPATVVDNAFGCGVAATLSIASSNAEFGATAGTTCSTISANFSTPVSAGSYPATITFTATKPNSQTANLTVTDTTNGGEGTASVTGVALTPPQALTFTAPTTTTFTYSPGETILVSVSNGGSNNPATFTVDSSSTGTGTFSSTTVTGTTSSATLTVTQAGSIVVDANELGGLASGTYYDAAPQVQLTLTINKAPQAIVFPQPNSPVTYATNPSTTVSLSANGGASANPVVFTVDPSSTGAGTISTSVLSNGTSTATLTVTGAGNIVVDANQVGNADYLGSPQVQQTVVVNQAAQTISFVPLTQPFHYIVTGATVTIQAAGGGSDSAIVFTVDHSSTMTGSFSASTVSGATSTSTLTLGAGQSPTSGTIVIDANQPGNANYLASAQTQFVVTVLAPLPTQSITFPLPQTQVGGTTLTLTAKATSGLPVAYTSSTTSACTVNGSVATFVNVTSATTCTITASQPGDNLYFAAAVPVAVSFTVNPAGQVPAMNLGLSIPSITIEPGTVGLTQITVTSQNNFTGTVTFACSGLPTGYTCTFNPNPITVAEDGSSTTTLTVTPPLPPQMDVLLHKDLKPFFPATLAVALCFLGFKKRNRLQLFLLLVVLFAGLGLMSGCGGTSNTSTQAPSTSTATITATSGSMQVSSTLTVTLE